MHLVISLLVIVVVRCFAATAASGAPSVACRLGFFEEADKCSRHMDTFLAESKKGR